MSAVARVSPANRRRLQRLLTDEWLGVRFAALGALTTIVLLVAWK
jgi:hypothetical protein